MSKCEQKVRERFSGTRPCQNSATVKVEHAGRVISMCGTHAKEAARNGGKVLPPDSAAKSQEGVP